MGQPSGCRRTEGPRAHLLFPAAFYFEAAFFFVALFLGILAPDLRASLSAMATACLRLATFLPLPDFNVPCFISLITLRTFRLPFELVEEDFFGIFYLRSDSAIHPPTGKSYQWTATCTAPHGEQKMPSIVWKGYISFGLVTFPVRLYSAARPESLHFHMLHRKDLSRVKEVWYCAEENKPIERSQIVKGYETGKGEYVVVEDEELKKIAPPTASTMEVSQFVDRDEVDPIWFERSYYVAGDEKVSKPYLLFLQALKETRRVAVARLSMHGRENVVLIRAAEEGMVLHTLFYPDELHQANRQTSLPKANASRKELDLAKTLIQQLSGPFKPEEFHDTYRENVEKLIELKRKGKKITPVPQLKPSPVIDLMEALKKSLASGKASDKKRKTSRGRRAA